METSYCVFNSTVVGHNHEKVGKVCEDYSGSYQNDNIRICIVADGHGSDNYPRTGRGSRFAVQAAMNCIIEFCKNVSEKDLFNHEQESIISQLAKSILKTWYGLVEDDYHNQPITEDELIKVSEKYKKSYLNGERTEKAYGTTLIAFVLTDNFSMGLQIGDGKCVVLNNEGELDAPIPDDPNCQLNVTTSICDSDAIDEFRYYVSKKPPVAVFCGSDGIEDSYSSIEEVYTLYRSITTIFATHGSKVGQNEVAEYLPVLTKRGSGDDVSIAGIIDMQFIKQLKSMLEAQTNLFKIEEELEKKQQRKSVLSERIINKVDKIKANIMENAKDYTNKQSIRDEYVNLLNELSTLENEIDTLAKKKNEYIYDIEKEKARLTDYDGSGFSSAGDL